MIICPFLPVWSARLNP
uniref:Uncharacterized protein n=1 Tax=Anguilla anguilla TaxID=7936 RepID=A0A0E9W135_ANGAN